MKAMMHTLEAMIAALLILGTLVAVYSFPKPQESFDSVTMREKGYFCMKDADNRGLLRYYALANDSIGIRNYFQGCLPRSLNFSLNFCAACAADIPANRTVISMNYIIAGEGASFQPTNANLFLWSLV